MTSPSLIHEAGHSKPEHLDNQEGWGEEEERWGSGWKTHKHPWLILASVWQKPLKYCNIFQLKYIKFLKKKEKCKSKHVVLILGIIQWLTSAFRVNPYLTDGLLVAGT